MKIDTQQFVKWAQRRKTSLRLAASYLLIIMIMSIGFSWLLYHTSARELGRQLPPDRLFRSLQVDDLNPYHEFFRERIAQGRSHLLHRLVLINLGVLVGGGLLSYLLARRTLTPIEEAMEAQARFAADASHELRTPLAALQAQNEVALRNPKLPLTKAKGLLKSNLEEIIRLQGLSEALLQLAREGGKLTLKPVKAQDVVSEAVAQCQKMASQKNIIIEEDVAGLNLKASQPNLTQALIILLDNAIKYSDHYTKITVSSAASGQHGFIAVKDEGIGISQEDLPHIFERFYRVDPSRSKRNVEGHGLGLALASKLVKQLKGELTASSIYGRGSTFTIKLPLA